MLLLLHQALHGVHLLLLLGDELLLHLGQVQLVLLLRLVGLAIDPLFDLPLDTRQLIVLDAVQFLDIGQCQLQFRYVLPLLLVDQLLILHQP